MIIAGLDVSSVVCGWNLYDTETDKFIEYGYHRFTKDEEPIKKAFEFEFHVMQQIRKADAFVLEDRMKAFSGKTTAQTLMVLSHINACVELILHQYTRLDSSKLSKIEKVNVRSARKRAGVEIKNGEDSKQKCFDFIMKRHPYITIEYKPRAGTPKEEMYDITDSMILSLSYN